MRFLLSKMQKLVGLCDQLLGQGISPNITSSQIYSFVQVRLLLSHTLILAIHTSAVSTNNSIHIQYKYNTKTIQRQIQKKTNTIQAQTQYKYKYITKANIVQLSLMCNPHHCPPTIQSLRGIQTLLIC